MKVIKVLLVDDHEVVRGGVKSFLSIDTEIRTVGEAESSEQALKLIEELDLDLVLMDLDLPGVSGWKTMHQIKNIYPKLPVLIFSIFPETHYGIRLIKEGAAGYLSKNSSPQVIRDAIKITARGGRYVSPLLVDQLFDADGKSNKKSPHEILSEREFQILFLILSGKKVKEISEELNISVTTVSTHKGKILEKMQMNNTTELIRHAIKIGLIT
ncbi:MAG: two-component system invasion response regulator UvrY [Nitrospinales bacterium]|jgi:two-component system invasion response regulator UvrY